MARKTLSDVELILSENLDKNGRLIFFTGEVDEDSVQRAIKQLHILSADTDRPIEIMLNSGGGDVVQGLALYDFIVGLPNPVVITVFGECYSMASIILQAADTRRISKNSSVMIHDGESAVSGQNRETVKSWATFYEEMDRRMDDILLAAINKKNKSFTKSKLRTLMRKDTIFTAEQALELGLVDEIVQ